MTLPTIFQIESFGDIRMTADFEFSAFDVVRVVGAQKAPHKVWERIVENYSEVLTYCQNFKFTGKGQRETPVLNRQGVLYLIGLLPGTVGNGYRKLAAESIDSLINDPAKLAKAAINQNNSKGYVQVTSTINEVANDFKKLLTKYGMV